MVVRARKTNTETDMRLNKQAGTRRKESKRDHGEREVMTGHAGPCRSGRAAGKGCVRKATPLLTKPVEDDDNGEEMVKDSIVESEVVLMRNVEVYEE